MIFETACKCAHRPIATRAALPSTPPPGRRREFKLSTFLDDGGVGDRAAAWTGGPPWSRAVSSMRRLRETGSVILSLFSTSKGVALVTL